MKLKTRRRILTGCLAVLTVMAFLLALRLGAVKTTWSELFSAFFSEGNEIKDILLNLRLPRALLAYLVGASLALSGTILQGYFRNPLADPFILGASSGASLGAVLSLNLGITFSFFGFSTQSLLAFLASLALVLSVYLIAERGRWNSTESLLLTGIAAGALASAFTSFLIFRRADAYEQAVFWLLGSFALADWNQVSVIFICLIISMSFCLYLARDLNLLVLGDEMASSLGCPVKTVRRVFLVLATLLASFSVSACGVIGFVGLIVPHAVRLFVGPDHRYLMIYATLSGGLFLLISDLIARLVFSPAELPVGVVTAAFGAPFFIYLLHRRRA